MKLKNLLFVALLTLSFSATSQVNPHAIGVRLGGSHYGHYGGEISYQHGFGDKNRLEIDLGGRNHKHWSFLGLSVIYHWVWNIASGFNWYVGPGAQVGFWRDKGWYDYDDGMGLAIGGQIGIEYDFNTNGVPILLSLDARPMWDFLTRYGGFGYGLALGVRYTF